jgi:hypothetical protein
MRKRTERIPFGVPRLKMNLDQETLRNLESKGLVPRWVNETDSRLINAEKGGYEFINSKVKVGDEQKEVEDQRIKQRVGTNRDGSPMFSYLMAIPKEYYDEDQAEKEKINKKVDDAIRGGSPPGLQNHGVSPNLGSVTVEKVSYKP